MELGGTNILIHHAEIDRTFGSEIAKALEHNTVNKLYLVGLWNVVPKRYRKHTSKILADTGPLSKLQQRKI